MFNSIDKWLLKRYVKEAERLSPEGLDYLFEIWTVRVGWRRCLPRWQRVLVAPLILTFALLPQWIASFPFIWIAIALFAMTVIWMSFAEIGLRLTFLRIWRMEQFCEDCGYDLRGIASTTTRCPECGREWNRQVDGESLPAGGS